MLRVDIFKKTLKIKKIYEISVLSLTIVKRNEDRFKVKAASPGGINRIIITALS